MLGYLELLREDEDGLTEQQEAYLAVVERNAQRLLRLVGDLLFTAQADTGHFPLNRREASVSEIVRSSAESAGPTARARSVSIEVDADDGLEAFIDPERLGQAVDNLLSNAIKFSPAGGVVKVNLRLEDDCAHITVSDRGIGIPAAELDRLATKFFRASTASKMAVPGVGLGLSITKTIINSHGGTLDVDSVEGEGTSFTISIPVGAP